MTRGELNLDGTILIVDDEAMVRGSLGRLLGRAGYSVRFAEDGKAALAAFETPGVDLVLLDLNMPGLSGFETCRRIRNLPTGTDVPILMLTGQVGEDVYREALASGADDFLNKPIQFPELLLRVASMLRLGSLLDTLRRSVGTLQIQCEALHTARKERDHINSFLLHDLKSPVSTILLQAEMMRETADFGPEHRQAWDTVFEAAAHAKKLVAGWLDFSTWEALGFEINILPVAVPQLLRALQTHVEPWLQHKNLRFETLCDPSLSVVHLDEIAMIRVLRNILDNCVRHAPSGSTLTLSLTSTSEQGPRFQIQDQGAGVPPEARQAIFDLFTQLEAASSREPRHHHHGMGLAFCKLAVEAHGGHIWVEDAPGGGACFVIELPPSRASGSPSITG